MARRKITHDWTGQMGGFYKCSCCRLNLTDKTLNSGCQGMSARRDNEHKYVGEIVRNIYEVKEYRAQ